MKSYFKIFFLIALSGLLPAKASLLWNLQDGVELYNKTQYKEARDFFENYILNNPNDENGYYQLGRVFVKLKNNQASISNFEKAYNLASKYKTLEKIRFEDDTSALNDYFDMAVMYFQDKNFKEADFYADLMLKLDSKNASAWFLKAKIAFSKGVKDDAKKYMDNAILYDNKLLKTNLAKKLNIYSPPPVSKEKYYMFAFENYYKGNIERAIGNCTKYLEAEPLNQDINILLSQLYLMQNNTELALKTLENVEKSDENIEYLLLRAKFYEQEKKPDEQKKALLKAYKINPNNSKLLYDIGNYYLKNDDYKNALKYFEALINTDDGFYEGYFGYIMALIETGKTNKALNYIRKANSINPKQSEINYLLALICFNQGQYTVASDYISEALSLHKNSNYLLLKAKILYYSKKYKESVEILNEIEKLPQSVYNHSEIGEYLIKNYIKQNDYQSAQYSLINEKIKLDKNPLLYKYILYKIYKSEGNDKKAGFLFGQIKMSKPDTPKEYLDLSEILYEEENLDSAIKLLDRAIKKMPEEYKLYSHKIKIYDFSGSIEKSKEISDEINKKFN